VNILYPSVVKIILLTLYSISEYLIAKDLFKFLKFQYTDKPTHVLTTFRR